MKIIIGIICSGPSDFNRFIDIQKTNKNDNILVILITDSEDDDNHKIILNENLIEFKVKNMEKTKNFGSIGTNMFNESYIDMNYDLIYKTNQTINEFNKGDYFIRSTCSTLINYKLLLDFLKEKPRNNFFAGPLINCNEKYVYNWISGTCLIMSHDIADKLKDKSFLDYAKNSNIKGEDIIISKFLYNENLFYSFIKRLDFINYKEYHKDDTINFHRCFASDSDIFCFRFKTLNRKKDQENQEKLLEYNFNFNKLIYDLDWKITEEIPSYGIYQNICFNLKQLNEIWFSINI